MNAASAPATVDVDALRSELARLAAAGEAEAMAIGVGDGGGSGGATTTASLRRNTAASYVANAAHDAALLALVDAPPLPGQVRRPSAARSS